MLVAFSSLLEHSIQYTIEARMYEWGALFLLLAYLQLYNIIEYDRTRDYILFTIFGLGAAYTHYYCLVSVAFFYAALLIYFIIKKKTDWLKLIATYSITILCYLPWFYVLLKTFIKTSSDYWIAECPSLLRCMGYLFDGKFTIIFFALLNLGLALALMLEFRLLVPSNEDKKLFPYRINISGFAFSNSAFFIITGIVSIIGTALSGIIVSSIFRPMFITRYLYPVSIIAWLLMGIAISKLRHKSLYCTILIFLICLSGIPEYTKVYTREEDYRERLSYTLEMTQDIYENPDDCIILSDKHALKRWVSNYYYPELKHSIIDVSTLSDSLPKDVSSLLFLTEELSHDEVTSLEKNGYLITLVLSNGHLGDTDVVVYFVSCINSNT